MFYFLSSVTVHLSTKTPSPTKLQRFKTILAGCIGELLGTFLFTTFITTAVATAAISGNSGVKSSLFYHFKI